MSAARSVYPTSLARGNRLAYQIEKKPEGIYAVVDVTAEPAVVQELDRQLNLNEAILRTKVTRPDHH